MSGAARVGQDVAGGVILTGSSDVLINGTGSARIGDAVEGHGNGEHSSPVMVTGSATVLVNGIPACRSGDVASCGDTCSGSPDVLIGG